MRGANLRSHEMRRYPINLCIEGRCAVVVGGGTVAERKIRMLLDGGAIVRVIAPAASDEIQRWATAGRLSWEAARFEPEHLEGTVLVFAATAQRDVNEEVVRVARRLGIWVNCADAPEESDFHVPAVLRRGDLVIGVSTGGRCPGFSVAIKRRLENAVGPELALALEIVAAARSKLMETESDAALKPRYENLLTEALITGCRERDGGRLDALLQDTLGAGYTLKTLGLKHWELGMEKLER